MYVIAPNIMVKFLDCSENGVYQLLFSKFADAGSDPVIFVRIRSFLSASGKKCPHWWLGLARIVQKQDKISFFFSFFYLKPNVEFSRNQL